ncbi:carboxymuconolactone decarboxylase family protein [Sulfurospirillum cavolei]|uniref:carboxymuconolactone decarboxylase family protein n=1 Tax=Sulfurospirillum cavolei TaxID=366522 RepID=UPI003FA25846
MPLIQTIKPEDATGELAELYGNITAMRGRVSNSAQLFSASPELIKQQMSFIEYYMLKQKSLSMPLLASIRMLISDKNSCSYCVDMNASILINMLGWTPKEVEAMPADPQNAKLDEKEKAMLLFVLKAVRTPHDVNAHDVQKLRDLGYSDGEILDATNHGARMSAIDIIFDAFKIEKDF